MKKIIIVFILLLAVTNCNCGRKLYNFRPDQSNIQAIQLVSLGDPLKGVEHNQTVICEIQDISEFLLDFYEMACYENHIPTSAKFSPVIKIIYKNGDYILIDYQGQSEFRDGSFWTYEGRFYFEKEQFQALIQKYMPTE